MANESELMQVRFEKEEKIKEYGIKNRPERYERTTDIEGARALEDGTKDICVFHARCYDEITGDPLYDPNRHTMMIEVVWDENGRPVFDLGKKYLL